MIATWLMERGVDRGAAVLDAGCGTGRYAVELARRGYVVHGIDGSAEQIAEARGSIGGLSGALSFTVGDITALSPAQYDAVLCRGVLNDFIDDDSRQAVFTTFGRVLRTQGVLILDVREWEATAERKVREPLFRESLSALTSSQAQP